MEDLEVLLLCALTKCCFADSMMSSDSLLSHDLLLDSPLPSIFVVLCVGLIMDSYHFHCHPAAAAPASSSSTQQQQQQALPLVSRECWKLQREDATWQGVQRYAQRGDPLSRDFEWRKLCRMSYPSFINLVEQLRPYIHNPSKDLVREPIDTERAVAMVLHRLASGLSPRAIADMYNTGASTVTKYTKLITGVLANHAQLYSNYIVVPSGDRLGRIIGKYSSLTGITNICGSIGGTHIKLHSKPKSAYSPANYLCGDGFFSVLLQGVCDADKVFWDVCCNAPGGLDDTTHLRASSLWRKMVNEEILMEPTAIIQGRELRLFLAGDKPYPLTPFLITPFSLGREDALSENVFDSQLLKASSKINDAFGVMKNRWKILNNVNTDLKYVAQTVMACCVLHNLCQLAGEPEPESSVDDYSSNRLQCHTSLYENDMEFQEGGATNRRLLFWDWFRRRHEEAEEERLRLRCSRLL